MAIQNTSNIPQEHSLYYGNVMYHNQNIKREDQEYVTLMVRYCDEEEIEELPVALFVPRGTMAAIDSKVGDLLAFRAKALVEGNTAMEDGTPVNRVAGFDPEFGLQIVARKKILVNTKKTGNKVQSGLAGRVSELMKLALAIK